MAMEQVQSSLLAALGARLEQAHAAVKNDETVTDTGGRLPAGIERGVAQLRTCKFGLYKDGPNKGKPFFMASGAVLEPKIHNGVPIEGMRTQIGPEPLNDTPDAEGKRKTLVDHLRWVENQLRLLGVNTANMRVVDLEPTCKYLEQQKPYFVFRTWSGKATERFPNPRTNEVWGGTIDYKPAIDDGMVDNITPPSTNGATPPAGPGTRTTGGPIRGAGAVITAPAPADGATSGDQSGDQFSEFGDLSSLADLADNGDSEAVDQITAAALGAGMTQQQIEAMDNWTMVVDYLNGMAAGGDDQLPDGPTDERAVEPPQPIEPERGKIYRYQPTDAAGNPLKNPKTKQPWPPVDVEAVAVDKKGKKVALKNLVDGKTIYKGVSWDALLPPS